MNNWVDFASYTIPEGRNEPIIFPNPLIASYVAVTVIPYKKNRWRKAGDLTQQFKGGVESPAFFVPFNRRTAYEMDRNFGDYWLIFTPVFYHKGFEIRVWRIFPDINKPKPDCGDLLDRLSDIPFSSLNPESWL